MPSELCGRRADGQAERPMAGKAQLSGTGAAVATVAAVAAVASPEEVARGEEPRGPHTPPLLRSARWCLAQAGGHS